MDLSQLGLVFNGITMVTALGLAVKVGSFMREQEHHRERIAEHDKKLEKHDDKIGVLEQKWSSVSHLP